jgi:hypothetical protein
MHRNRALVVTPVTFLFVTTLAAGLALAPQIATANQHCRPGEREVSEARGLNHCEAVAWICRSQGPNGHWGRGWNNDQEAAKQRALYECNIRSGGGCSAPSCTRQQTAQLPTIQKTAQLPPIQTRGYNRPYSVPSPQLNNSPPVKTKLALPKLTDEQKVILVYMAGGVALLTLCTLSPPTQALIMEEEAHLAVDFDKEAAISLGEPTGEDQ